MNKKRIIIVTIIIILVIILGLWISGIIPKQIARISATYYLKKNFPKMQLEYVNIEWSSSFGGYSITFKDEKDEMYGFIINSKYFPISLGQGLFGFEEKYNEKYNDDSDKMKATIKAVVVKVNENNLLAMGIENGTELYSIGLKNYKDIEFEKEQEILVHFSGDVMETYPAQLGNIGKIEIIKEKSDIQIPDNIIRFCYNSKDKVSVTISELTNSGIILTIKDENELPYNYSHSYTINKKVKNENYTGVGQKIGEDTENSTSGFTRYRSRIYLERSK
ncbi:MAG: hypothetical protein ACI35S_09615 [Anaeroplasma sp.]